jgi:hypothetical protein
MPRALIALCLFASTATSAEIFRWVDADGRTYYSDRPQDGAETVGLVPKSPTPTTDAAVAAAEPAESALIGPYRGFQIVSPEPNQTVRQEQGKLPVSLILDPTLIAGHRLELVVDGATVPVQKGATQLSLSGLAFGTHSAQALIRDAENAIVARTVPVAFHLLPPGVLQ